MVDPEIPPAGLEPVSITGHRNNDLGQSPFPSGAESGAVAAEATSGCLTPDALAAALLSLPLADRALLAALLLGQQPEQGEGKS
jgi:hypothetical protein